MDEQKLADLKPRAEQLAQQVRSCTPTAKALTTASPRPAGIDKAALPSLLTVLQEVDAFLQMLIQVMQPAAGLKPAGMPDRAGEEPVTP